MNTPINHVSADVSPTLRSQAAGQIMASGSGVNALAATTMQKAPATKSRKKASTVTAERLQAMASVRTTPAKGRLLWVGDATVPTGFATVTHSVLQHLHQDWEVSCPA